MRALTIAKNRTWIRLISFMVTASLLCSNTVYSSNNRTIHKTSLLSSDSHINRKDLYKDWKFFSINLLLANLKTGKASFKHPSNYVTDLTTSQIKEELLRLLNTSNPKYMELASKISEIFLDKDGTVYVLYKFNDKKSFAVRIIDSKKKDDLPCLEESPDIGGKKIQFITTENFYKKCGTSKGRRDIQPSGSNRQSQGLNGDSFNILTEEERQLIEEGVEIDIEELEPLFPQKRDETIESFNSGDIITLFTPSSDKHNKFLLLETPVRKHTISLGAKAVNLNTGETVYLKFNATAAERRVVGSSGLSIPNVVNFTLWADIWKRNVLVGSYIDYHQHKEINDLLPGYTKLDYLHYIRTLPHADYAWLLCDLFAQEMSAISNLLEATNLRFFSSSTAHTLVDKNGILFLIDPTDGLRAIDNNHLKGLIFNFKSLYMRHPESNRSDEVLNTIKTIVKTTQQTENPYDFFAQVFEKLRDTLCYPRSFRVEEQDLDSGQITERTIVIEEEVPQDWINSALSEIRDNPFPGSNRILKLLQRINTEDAVVETKDKTNAFKRIRYARNLGSTARICRHPDNGEIYILIDSSFKKIFRDDNVNINGKDKTENGKKKLTLIHFLAAKLIHEAVELINEADANWSNPLDPELTNTEFAAYYGEVIFLSQFGDEFIAVLESMLSGEAKRGPPSILSMYRNSFRADKLKLLLDMSRNNPIRQFLRKLGYDTSNNRFNSLYTTLYTKNAGLLIPEIPAKFTFLDIDSILLRDPDRKGSRMSKDVRESTTLENILLECDTKRRIDITPDGIRNLYESAERCLLQTKYSPAIDYSLFLNALKENSSVADNDDFYRFFIAALTFSLKVFKHLEPHAVSMDPELAEKQNPVSRLLLNSVLFHADNINKHFSILLVDDLPHNSMRYYDKDSDTVYIVFNRHFVLLLLELYARKKDEERPFILWIFIERLLHGLAHDNPTPPLDLALHHYSDSLRIYGLLPNDVRKRMPKKYVKRFYVEHEEIEKQEETYIIFLDLIFFRYFGARLTKSIASILNERIPVRIINGMPVSTGRKTTVRDLLNSPGEYYKFLKRLNEIWNRRLEELEKYAKPLKLTEEEIEEFKLKIEIELIQLIRSEWIDTHWSQLHGKGSPQRKRIDRAEQEYLESAV